MVLKRTDSNERGQAGPKRAYDITISSVTGIRTIQFRVSRTAAVAALAGTAGLLLVILAGAVTAGHQIQEAARARSLRLENAEFRRQLSRMAEMEERIRVLEDTRVSLLRIMGVEEGEAPDVRPESSAVEGQDPSPLYAQASPDSLIDVEQLTEIQGVLRLAPVSGGITRGFGRIESSGIFHTGIDIAGDTGAEVVAPGDGVVSFVGTDETFGEVIVISHRPDLETMYGHNSKILAKVGDSITAGQVVTRIGNTGQSSAPHLHFEIHWRGKAVNPESVYSISNNRIG
jgi:murein DD-endopeptidase MepM/ murein hydrolase activator NlpD